MKKAISGSLADVEFGKEPTGINFNSTSVSKHVEAFNYYNYKYNTKLAREILAKIHPEIEWDEVRAVDFSATYAWMYRLEKKGNILSEEMIAKRSAWIDKCRKEHPKGSKKKVEATPADAKIVDTYPDKKWLADFDDIEDNFWKTFNLVEAIDKVKVLVSTLNKSQGTDVRERCRTLLSELDAIPTDKQLKEAYSPYNSSNIRVAKKWLTTIIEHISYTAEVKRIVKPRKKKIVPLAKKLQHFQYQRNSEEFKLVSVDPEKVLGANIVWTFNTKTRDLAILESTEGFDVKGTTLINGNTVKVKKIRKPEMMKEFTSTKLKMAKDFAALKVNERNGNYRINKDTILLKVF